MKLKSKKLKSKLIIVSAVLIFCAGCALFLRFYVKAPIEQMAQTVLEDPNKAAREIPSNKMTPDLANFLGWYQPMVADASPEVRAVMKRFDAKLRASPLDRNEEIEQVFPTHLWIQKLLNMGIAFDDFSDYSGYLNFRKTLFHAKNDPEVLSSFKYQYGLDEAASWDEVVDAGLRFDEKLNTFVDQAMAADKRVYGGSMGREGVFVPVRLNTVYVESTGAISYGTGVPEWVGREIGDRESGRPPSRNIPDDIDIIYLDEKGQPIKDRVPPNGGEIEGFSSGETDTVFDSTDEQSPLTDDFDNSFPDDLPPSDTESYEFEKPNVPQNGADLEKQFSPEGIEAELTEGLSADRFDKAQQLIEQYGTEEGLRRLRASDPEAARRFEQGLNPEPSRDAPKGRTHPDGQSPDDSP